MEGDSSDMPAKERPYELILYGATGYTGKLCAEHIVEKLPTDLKWAVAGRDRTKLAALVEKLRRINPDRTQPGIETADLKKDELDALAKKAQLIITTVGPYAIYGEPVLAACVENGTHYLDCTGEIPWVYNMVQKYHEKARVTGTIIIPQCGVDSVPADIIAFVLAQYLRETYSVPTLFVQNCLYTMEAEASGGTIASIINLFDTFSTEHLAKTAQSFALSPIPPSPNSPQVTKSWFTKMFGIRTDPDFGTLTTWFLSTADIAAVHRSWGLLQQAKSPLAYGPNFRFDEGRRARNWLTGIGIHLAHVVAGALLLFAPMRWLVKLIVPKSGQGPDLAKPTKDNIEFRAIATADSPKKERAQASLQFSGNMYQLTAIALVEAAMVMLRGGESKRQLESLGGGLLTSACLGTEFAERLRNGGIKIDVGPATVE